MAVDVNVVKQYSKYIKTNDKKWEYANSILYRMCETEKLHVNEDIIVGKIWLIGRSYAAAIERRKNATNASDGFYYDIVAPKLLEIGPELDDRLDYLRKSKGRIVDEFKEILSTHKFLMDAFYELTGLEKRSLASKYLHFHCPEKFFIYDSRARAGIGKLVKKPDTHLLTNAPDYDPEYGVFVCRMIELQEYLQCNLNLSMTDLTPRKMDSFLLTTAK